MRILISGGHLTPALAFIEYIRESHPEVEIFFAGRKYSRKKDKQLSQEQEEVSKFGVTYIPFQSGKLGRGNITEKILNGVELTAATIRASFILPKYRPDVFVSFGGYLAVPLAIAAWMWRVPIITHEQTRAAGIANKLIAKIATKIALSFPESQSFYPANKTVLTGNPVRKAILTDSNEAPDWYSTSTQKPLLYVTGGSQGSEIINTTLSRALPTILKDWSVIHQCGRSTKHRNYQQELEKASRKLTRQKSGRYFVRPWISESELAWIYTNAAAIVSRAGANTTTEITMRRVPAILVPLPFSHNDEQLLNAKAISDTGGALLVLQKNFNTKTLLTALDTMLQKPKSFRKKLQLIESDHRSAAENLYNLTQQVIK